MTKKNNKSDKLLEYPEGLPDTKVRSYVSITDPSIVDSFLDPIRRAILVTLRHGIDSIKKESKESIITRDDGTTVKTIVVEETKVKRMWMSVPEIVSNTMGEVEVSKYNCYYHLPILIQQGLVEQYPPPEYDKDGRETSSRRGLYYRRTAKVFVISSSKMSDDLVKDYMTLFEKGFGMSMTKKTRERLEDLMIRQVELIDEAMEYIAVHLKEVELDSTVLNDMLTEMSYVFLSDNQDFLKIQREIKRLVLTPCCGKAADMTGVCSFCGDTLLEDAVVRVVDGKEQSFCSDTCATSYLNECAG